MSDTNEIRDFVAQDSVGASTEEIHDFLRHIRTLLEEVDFLVDVTMHLQTENTRLATALEKIEELPRSMVPDSHTAMVDMARIAREALKEARP